MTTPLIKICGITDASEALELARLGVDFLGFNFYPESKRYITPEKAGEIVSQLHGPKIVGVFVNENPASLINISQKVPLDLLQLHGNEGPGDISGLRAPVIKAVGIAAENDFPDWDVPEINYWMYDAKDLTNFGGTGKPFDWNFLNSKPSSKPFFLAGGLGPHNLREAVDKAKPFAVDLNSKVEFSPGRKDLQAVQQCLKILGR